MSIWLVTLPVDAGSDQLDMQNSVSQPFDDWRRHTEEQVDLVNSSAASKLAATLGLGPWKPEIENLPPLWHWLFTTSPIPQQDLGVDGHPRRGVVMPPTDARRRMFAGGTIRHVSPISNGDEIARKSVATSVETKRGRSGAFLLVSLDNRYFCRSRLTITETQQIVYTDTDPTTTTTTTTTGEHGPIPNAPLERSVSTDEALLFRFSALTFNAHRIHYDRTYATSVEGYPDLVVHGPLIAILLAELARDNGQEGLTQFDFRSLSPTYVNEEIHLRGWPTAEHTTLRAFSADGRALMEAELSDS